MKKKFKEFSIVGRKQASRAVWDGRPCVDLIYMAMHLKEKESLSKILVSSRVRRSDSSRAYEPLHVGIRQILRSEAIYRNLMELMPFNCCVPIALAQCVAYNR